MIMDNEMKGTLFALATALISGFSIIVNKVFIASIDPTVFTAVRAFIIGITFFVIALHRKDFQKELERLTGLPC